MPVVYRKWFLDRLLRDFTEKNKMRDNQNNDVNHDNISKLKQYEDMLSKKTQLEDN